MTAHQRYLQIMRLLSNRRTMRIARELGIYRATAPTPEGARCFRELLEQLGTTFIKLGQLLSTRPDLIPELYAEELTHLQDSIEPFPVEEAIGSIELSLGRSIDEVFETFEAVPLASASIAQIHKAQLRTGEVVAVKVRRPGIGAEIQRDLEILARLAKRADARIETAALIKIRSIVDELDHNLSNELDMRLDASNMQSVSANLGDFPLLHVPRVFEDHVTPMMFVMEHVEGVKVTQAVDIDDEIASDLADELLRAYMKQILVDGIYHADPHAGNVFVTNDNRLALLDFGLLGRLDENMRVEMAFLLLALAENRADDLADMLLRMSFTQRDSDEQRFHQELRRLLPRYHQKSLGDISIGRGLVEIQQLALDCRISLPIAFALMGKTLSQIDSIARSLNPRVEPFDVVRRYTMELAQGNLRHSLHPSAMLERVGTPALSLLSLPRHTERLMEKLERGELTVGVAPAELDDLVHEARTVTNRLSAAIITAASVIASALLMNVDGVGTLFGYPALGFVGFTVSSAIGLILLFRMLRTTGGL